MNESLILLSIQHALLGKVTPNLRAVFVTIENEIIHYFFYYNSALSEEEEELASLADTEIIADFPLPEYKTDCTVIVLPYPNEIVQRGSCAYMRYEE